MSAVIPDPALTDWVPLGGVGGGGSMIALQEVVVPAGGAASIDFQNIPQTYTSLILRGFVRSDQAAAQVGWLRFNGDAGANYDYEQLLGSLNVAAAAGAAAQPGVYAAYVNGSGSPAGAAAAFETTIPGYAQTTWRKAALGLIGYTDGTVSLAFTATGNWRSTAAINRVTLAPGAGLFAAGSRATLYGLAAPGVTLPSYGPFYGTSPPTDPIEGTEWILPVGNGVVWRFRYNAASASAYKWEFIGGAPVSVHVDVQEAHPGGSAWVNLTTNGPLLAVPRAGDYVATATCDNINTNAGNATGQIGIAVGDTTPSRPIAIGIASGFNGPLVAQNTLLGVAAAAVVKMRYWVNATGWNFNSRTLRVTPIRVA